MTTLRKPMMAVAPLALALTIGGLAPASSGATQTSPSTSQQCSNDKPITSDTTLTKVTGSKATDLKTAANAAVNNGKVTLHAPKSDLAVDDAKVNTVKAGDTTQSSVTIPVGGKHSTVSNVTILFDQSGKIAQYGETLFTKNSADNFQVTSYADGKLVQTKDTKVGYMSDAALKKAPTGDYTAQGTAGCVAAVLGVSGVTATLIVSACTGACAVPGVGTAVCVACIGAYATVGGASVTAVASCFK